MKSPLSSFDADLRCAGASQPRPLSAAAGCKWAAAVQQVHVLWDFLAPGAGTCNTRKSSLGPRRSSDMKILSQFKNFVCVLNFSQRLNGSDGSAAAQDAVCSRPSCCEDKTSWSD